MEFSYILVGGDIFFFLIFCGYWEDFKVLIFSDVFGDLCCIVLRSLLYLFIFFEMIWLNLD